MNCPYCKMDNNRVDNSRTNKETNITHRVRECLNCHRKFKTQETVALKDDADKTTE